MSYFEQCAEIVDGIDATALANTGPRKSTNSGGGFDFSHLGSFSVGGVTQSLGMKGPLSDTDYARIRLKQELTFVDYCLSNSPELNILVPSFMGILAIEGSKAEVFLTEDATEDGALAIRPMLTPQDTRQLLYAPFREQGSYDDVMSNDELNFTLAFRVDGRPRLLDFTPFPIKYSMIWEFPPFKERMKVLGDKLAELVITIPKDTVLGEYIDDNYSF